VPVKTIVEKSGDDEQRVVETLVRLQDLGLVSVKSTDGEAEAELTPEGRIAADRQRELS
jgi:predicted transcriptional regulator